MLFGASSAIWGSALGEDEVRLAKRIADLGFDVLEVWIENPFRVDALALRSAAEEVGVGVSVCGVFGPDRDLSHEDSERRQAGVDYLKFCADVAAEVGSANVVGPMCSVAGKAGPSTKAERERQQERAVRSLGEEGFYAGERGVGLAIEPLNRFETNLVNTVEQGLVLCEQLDLDNIGLLLDTFQMNIEEEGIPDAIRAASARLRHLHASENHGGTPGSGSLDWNGIFFALGAVGYESSIVIEPHIPRVTEAMRASSAAWDSVSLGDDLAREGLAFLKQKVSEEGLEMPNA